MNKYYTQIREQQDGTFVLAGGENPDDMKEMGREKTYKAAQQYRAWWVETMGVKGRHVNHGFTPLVAMQGRIPGH